MIRVVCSDAPIYGILMASGIVISGASSCCIIWKRKMDVYEYINMMTYELLIAIIFSKFYYILVSGNTQIRNIYSFFQSGYSFTGAIIGVLIGTWIIFKFTKIKILEYYKQCIYVFPLIHGFVKLGCFFNSCCYGVKYSGIGAVVYENSKYVSSRWHVLPIQLIEAIISLSLSIIILTMIIQRKNDYNIIIVCIVVQLIVRFFADFFRYNANIVFGYFSVTQIVILLIIILIVNLKLKFSYQNNQSV